MEKTRPGRALAAAGGVSGIRHQSEADCDFDPADAIGAYWGNPATHTFAELLIDCEEDRVLRAVLIGMLREDERR